MAQPPPGASLAELARAAVTCTACPLHLTGTQTVFGRGPRHAAVMLVGEQPGDVEDRIGEPFVGPAGKVLREVLAEVGLAPERVYVTNAVKHFKWEPRGKRRLHAKPNSREMAACRPWLMAELGRVRPKVLVALGVTAAKSLLGPSVRLMEQRGRPLQSDLAPYIVVTVHPSSLLRIPDREDRHAARAAFAADMARVAALAREGETSASAP